jgi:uncharacterized cupin superfamily protein
VSEAQLEDGGSGLAPTGDGWFVVNVRDAEWWVSDAFGSGCGFESEAAPFKQLGINISVVMPGQSSCLYHAENQQEDFLVLAGEATLLVEEEERPLHAWDLFHCPPWTKHVVVGAGDGPCVFLATGARLANEELLYPLSELATRHGAGAEAETPNPREAYARFERPRRERPAYWDQLPWS